MSFHEEQRIGFHKVMEIKGVWETLEEQINRHVLSGYWKLHSWQYIPSQDCFFVVFERIKGTSNRRFQQ